MKIVTYNINGLRPRVLQFGSLSKLLDSLDADIICFQETKLSRQELTADLVVANGYECFFSCTRTSDKGRVSYSGVATFCRVKSAFSSNEVALPFAAEEGFTGVLGNVQASRAGKVKLDTEVMGLEEFPKDELLKVDSEGRCIITDHGHFVLFNIYGPRAKWDDTERIQFKHTFFKILQKRWEFLLNQGRRIFVVGDLNIAPAAIDSCDPGPDFEKNEFRRWFKSILVENGGPFFDVFRAKHPERREAYTHWSQNTGAEEFNYGARIDHILSGGPCLHEDHNQEVHDFLICHVKECDIMTQFKRSRPGNSPRWKAGRKVKLEGSDHVPVYTSLVDIPDTLPHSTPSLSARYAPEVRGFQQTIVSVLMKRQVPEQAKNCVVSSAFSEDVMEESCSGSLRISSYDCTLSGLPSEEKINSLNSDNEGLVSRTDVCSRGSSNEVTLGKVVKSGHDYKKSTPATRNSKKARQSQSSQLSLKSFFQRSSSSKDADYPISHTQHNRSSNETSVGIKESHSPKQFESNDDENSLDPGEPSVCHTSETKKSDVALQEWQRIRELMQNSIPLCKGHSEPSVARVVKKPGPNFGRSFYVCARAEGPASNPETNCGYFKWAASKAKCKKG